MEDVPAKPAMSDAKKAQFEQQFARSGPASPPREAVVRTVVDGEAALDKYTTGGVSFKSMTSAPHTSQAHRRPPPLRVRVPCC